MPDIFDIAALVTTKSCHRPFPRNELASLDGVSLSKVGMLISTCLALIEENKSPQRRCSMSLVSISAL
jgi:hypothetical protein